MCTSEWRHRRRRWKQSVFLVEFRELQVQNNLLFITIQQQVNNATSHDAAASKQRKQVRIQQQRKTPTRQIQQQGNSAASQDSAARKRFNKSTQQVSVYQFTKDFTFCLHLFCNSLCFLCPVFPFLLLQSLLTSE